MKKLALLIFILVSFLIATATMLEASESKLEIQIEDLELTVNDTLDLEVVYIDTHGNEIDTTAKWKIKPGYLGSVIGDEYLVADAAGTGMLYAELGDLTDSVMIEIESDEPEEVADPELKVSPENSFIAIGDSIYFRVIYIDSLGKKTDTTGTWVVEPDSLGAIDEAGLFVAEKPGECLVQVTVGDLSVDASITIFPEEVEDEDDGEDQNGLCYLVPGDTLVDVGASLQFTLYKTEDDSNVSVMPDSLIQWETDGMPVGQLSETGLLTAEESGFAIIKAIVEEYEYSVFVVVKDTTADTTGANTVTITRSTPNPQGYAVVSEIAEGEVWTIGGLPYPMNILNGGTVYFPLGSLKEDIRIHMDLPGFTKPDSFGVSFKNHETVAAVDFQVFVKDTLSEPYYFEKPLYAGLVFKRGLLKNLDIDPLTLALYFAVEKGDSIDFVADGIDYITLDENLNRIFSTVAHFSTLAVKGEAGTLSIDPEQETAVVNDFRLFQNYPNPFNPTTTIAYNLPKTADVDLTIYNILGQRICTLVNRQEKQGMRSVMWNGKDDNGHLVPTGVYIYQIKTDGFTQARKMLFIK